ncbi:MAG TPA: hypothetical protein VN256_01780 [Pyrinomonadaceae bacterium]|nr:hypothetical protein [Pyrinomonadaceae bacterium]
MPTNKSLIVLQENSGRVPLDSSVPAALRQQISLVIDGLSEMFEDLKTTLQAAGRYDVVHLLTDNSCSRAKLLDALVAETSAGRTTDLIVLGHGSPEKLNLKVNPHLRGGASGNIRSLLTDAGTRGVNSLKLRMVYMCNCFGSTVNDDWLAIGAKVSVGSHQLDMMPEPMTTFFVHNWLAGQKARDAAKNAYAATIPFYLPIYPPTTRIKYKKIKVPYPCPTLTNPLKICKKTVEVPDGVEFTPNTYVEQTKLIVAGDQNARF